MAMFAGLDVGGKRTAVCMVDEPGKIIWRGMVDTHPEMIDAALNRFHGNWRRLAWRPGRLRRICSDRWRPWAIRWFAWTRRAADAIKSRRIKSDKAGA